MKSARTALVVLAAVALPACSGTDSVGPPTDLRSDEARALALSLAGTSQQFDGSSQVSDAASSVSTSATVPFTVTINQTLPCPDGGNVTVNVTINGKRGPTGTSVQADMGGTVNPRACAYSVAGGALAITGRPDMNVSARVLVDTPHPTGTVSFTASGVLDWAATDGRAGTCSVEFTAAGAFASNTRSFHGTVCGIPVNFTGSI